MAKVVNLLGHGGQSFAERVLEWNRCTIRKGQKELEDGRPVEDRSGNRGRPRVETQLTDLLEDIRSIVEPLSQTDPTFRSTRIYSPLSAEEIRKRLIIQYGYRDSALPCVRTIRNKLNELGFRLRKVRKCRPLKKIAETDAIFEEVHLFNKAADQDDGVLRISLDTKAKVKLGPFSRGGYSRQGEEACDHDFQAEATTTPFGIILPKTGDSHLWFGQGKVTADFMADRLEEMISSWKATCWAW